MRIGLLSDSHGKTADLKKALLVLSSLGADAIVHCGDICCLDSVELLKRAKTPAWLVSGNMDQHLKNQLTSQTKGTIVTFDHSTVEVPLGNNEYLIATHGDNECLLDELIRGGQFPYICQGHTHRASDVHHGKIRLICPGAISAPQHPNVPTVALLDTDIDTVDFYDISNGKTIRI